VLAVLGPLAGGFLVTTGAATVLARGLDSMTGPDGIAFLPQPETPWAVSAAALLGVTRKHAPASSCSGALAGHMCCALTAVVLHSFRERRHWLSVLCLILWVLATLAGAATFPVCEYNLFGVHCLQWVKEEEESNWQWPLFGCIVWMVITVASAWRQLGLLADWEADSFWRRWYKSGYYGMMLPQNGYDATATYLGAHHRREVDTDYGGNGSPRDVYLTEEELLRHQANTAGSPSSSPFRTSPPQGFRPAPSEGGQSQRSLSNWLQGRRSRAGSIRR